MNRREFLVAGLIGGPFAVAGVDAFDPKTGADVPVSFYLAGARFHRASEELRIGQRVKLRAETWSEYSCFAIYVKDTIRVGYVPKSFIAAVESRPEAIWRVVRMDP